MKLMFLCYFILVISVLNLITQQKIIEVKKNKN